MKIRFIHFIKEYKFNSIILRNFIKLFSIFVVILTIPVFIIFESTIRGVNSEAAEANKQQVQKLSSASEVVFRDVEYLASSLLSERDINVFLSLERDNNLIENISKRASALIGTYTKGRSNIYSVYLYSQRNYSMCSIGGRVSVSEFEDTTWLDHYSEAFTEGFKILPRKIGRYPNVFTFIKKTDNNAGAVVINVDMSVFSKTIENVLDKNTDFYIVDGDQIIYSSQKTKLFLDVKAVPQLNAILNQTSNIAKINGNSYVGNYEISKYYRWKYVGISLRSEYEARLHYMYFFLIAIILLFLIFVGAASILFSASNINQVVDIVDLIDNKDKIKQLKDNETTYLANKIIGFIDDNKKLREEINSRISEYEKLKLLILQSQINPHFLNNTLSAINKEVVLSYGHDTVVTKMIVKLSRLLQYCFVSDEILVPISSEVVFSNKYIDLLKLRYGTFRHEISIEPSILTHKILRLSLQPIVENAVFHGIKGMGEKGIVKIRGYDNGKGIVINIEDNGKGMTKEEIDNIILSFQNDDFDKKNIGIKNVDRRLKLIYGKSAGLKIESELGKYTKVSMIIPKE